MARDAALPGGRALTPRQVEVVRLLAAGGTYKDLARRLSISERTLSVHIDRIFLRLGVHDRAQAVRVAAERGLVDAASDGRPEPPVNNR